MPFLGKSFYTFLPRSSPSYRKVYFPVLKSFKSDQVAWVCMPLLPAELKTLHTDSTRPWVSVSVNCCSEFNLFLPHAFCTPRLRRKHSCTFTVKHDTSFCFINLKEDATVLASPYISQFIFKYIDRFCSHALMSNDKMLIGIARSKKGSLI